MKISISRPKNAPAIDNQITSTNEPATQSSPHAEHKERFRQRCSGLLPTFPLLGGTRDAGTTILAQWQATVEGEGGPVGQPVTHIPVGEPPQRVKEGDKQQRLLAIQPPGTYRT